jgi:hypothetical protein
MIDTSTIPASDYKRSLHHQDGSTQDIINVIIQADKKNDTRFCEFAKQFEPTKAGLKKLWKFARHQIKYQTDSFGTQDIKFPAALWKAKKGDCKSKTLFINQVLKCLGVDYITRFVKFRKDADYTHVYSVAILNGQRIPLDSVYEYFNREAPFFKPLDFMTKISTIEGYRNKNIGTAQAEDIYLEAQAQAANRYKEIQQRKQYVQPEQPINFAKLSEGAALSELLIRKLKIIGTMKDEQKATTEQGISLIRRAIETGKVSGTISDELQGVAARLTYYLSLNGSAVGHGIRGSVHRMNKLKARATNNVGRIPGTECLGKLFYEAVGGAGTSIDPYTYRVATDGSSLLDILGCGSGGLGNFNANNIYFYYGRSTNFRSSYTQSRQVYNTLLNNFVNSNRGLISDRGNGLYDFQTQAAYDTLLEELKQGMPVLSNWANDLFRADNTRTDGTVGSGMLYNFVPSLTQIAAINPGNFPPSVQTKMVFQQQYLDSCVNFSTISRVIFEDMSENGILFDNGGETPERILSALLLKYNPNVGEITAAVAALIIGIITAVLSSIPAIVSACNKGKENASTIDNSQQQTSGFKVQSPSTLPNMNDFTPLVQTGGGSSGSGSSSGGNNNNNNNNNNNSSKDSSPLPAIILGGGLFYVARKRKKK